MSSQVSQTTWRRFIGAPSQPPQPVVERAVRQIADGLACALAAVARGDEGSGIAYRHIVARSAPGMAGLFGFRERLQAADAAWLNAYLAHALDYDDYTLTSWIGHPTVVLLPALWAVAERDARTGAALVDAYIVGHEFGARLGLAAGVRQYELGWHNTSTIGTVAAAAAIARLREFDATRTGMALSIAASLASGLKRNFGTMTKPLHAAAAARNAVDACDLAAAGLTSAVDALTGAQGLLAALAGADEAEAQRIDDRFAEVCADLGQRWDLIDPGLGTKPYPSCAYSHWAIDAALAARQDGIASDAIASDAIDALVFACAEVVPNVCIRHRPATGLEGKFSLEYCAALALTQGKCGLDDFAPTPISDADVLKLMPLARYRADTRFATTPWGGELELRLKDGQIHRYRIDQPSGSPENPLTDAQRRAKFGDCLRSYDQSEVERCWHDVLALAADGTRLPCLPLGPGV